MERESLYKDRSFSSIIATAYRVQTDHIGRILRATWLPALLMSVAAATLLTVMLPSGQSLALTLGQSILVLIAAVATVACAIWADSRLMSLLNERPRKWNLFRFAILALNLCVIGVVLGVLASALLTGLPLLMGQPADEWLSRHWLLMFCLPLAISLLLLPVYYHAMRYLNEPELRFWRQFGEGYGRGLRHFGFIFLTLFVSGLILCLLYAIVSLPLFTLTFANTASFIGELNGDTPDLPSYFSFLYWMVCAVTVFVLFYIASYSLIVLYLMYGSIEKQIEDRRTGLSLSEKTPIAPQS